MGELIFPDFVTKSRQYTKGGGIDDLDIVDVAEVGPLKQTYDSSAYTAGLRGLNYEDTAPSEMPPVQPMYEAPDQDGA